MIRYGLLLPRSQTFDDGLWAEEPVALTPCGIYYHSRLAFDFSYIAAMATDTGIADEQTCRMIENLAEEGLKNDKLPFPTRIRLAENFVAYLKRSEKRELALGAVGKHPSFGQWQFCPRMESELKTVASKLQNR
jgi:hypothetical protein